jgi:hypothetical protein
MVLAITLTGACFFTLVKRILGTAAVCFGAIWLATNATFLLTNTLDCGL